MAQARPADAADALEALGRAYIRFALAFPEHFAVMFRPDLIDRDDRQLAAPAEEAYGALLGAVTAAADEGRVARRDIDAVTAAAWSLVHGFATLWLSTRLPERVRARDPHRLAARVSRLFVDAVLRRTG